MGPQEVSVESQAAWRLVRGAVTVFADQLARIFNDEDHGIDEHRELIGGHSVRDRLLVIAFTEREDATRIISARKAKKNERDYEEGVTS